jgi:ribosomal-protein-alanine N-acetyltransferase
MNLPVLTANGIVLRPITKSDTAALFHHFSNDTVTRYMDIPSFTNISEATQIIQFFRDNLAKGTGMRWAITFADHAAILGTCGLHNINKVHFKGEIGYDLHPDYWGKGIMTTAVQEVLLYAFDHLQLNRVEAFVDPSNTPSSNLLRRTGFEQEGLLRDAFFEKGKFVDAELYSILKRTHDRENIFR